MSDGRGFYEAFRHGATQRKPVAAEDVGASNSLSPVWSFAYMNLKDDWAFSGAEFIDEILQKLCNFERMTWQEIIMQIGGPSKGTNNHPIPINELSKEAQKKLDKRKLLFDEVFSLRLSGKKRIYGVREGRILRIIWYCAEHQACESTKKHS